MVSINQQLLLNVIFRHLQCCQINHTSYFIITDTLLLLNIKYNFHIFTIMINALKIQKCKNSCTNIWHSTQNTYLNSDILYPATMWYIVHANLLFSAICVTNHSHWTTLASHAWHTAYGTTRPCYKGFIKFASGW